MIKVFLVEDEIVIREGIKKNIDWQSEGFEFAGEASDGELAYPLILNVKPDILITDIKMPFMDGLELSRLVKKELPDIKILVLSGYNEFEYAKEAIGIGITDYLVKPISSEKLLLTVKKVAKTIEEERQQKQFLLAYQKEQEEGELLRRQNFFGRLVSGKFPVSGLLHEAKELGMDLGAAQYNIVLFQVFTEEKEGNYSDDINRLTMQVEELAKSLPQVILIERGMEGFAFLLKGTESCSIEENLSLLLERLKEAMEEYKSMEYFGGIGTAVERLSELKSCFEKANRAYAYRYLMERNQFMTSDMPNDEAEKVDEELNLGALNIKNLERKGVERFLATGLLGEVSDFVEEFFLSLGEQNIQSMLFRQYITMDAYITTAGALEKWGHDSKELVEECGDFKSMADMFSTIEQTRDYLKNVFSVAIRIRDRASQKKYARLIEDAKEYIRQNFCSEEISLNMVAASVNLSPNHFSTIFSQEMGQTFIEYLTFVRMEKAKELLRNSNMKTSDIAFQVGYRDAHYFSYIFKKTQECTPREYRGKS